MAVNTLVRVFSKMRFADEMPDFSNVVVSNVKVNEYKRSMTVYLADTVSEYAVDVIKKSLRGHFSVLSDVQVIMPRENFEARAEPKIPRETPRESNNSYRNAKVNKHIKSEITPLSEELVDGTTICVRGKIFNLDKRTFKNGKILFLLEIHGLTEEDCHSAASVKLFATENADETLEKGASVTVRGRVVYDEYAKDTVIMADTIAPGPPMQIRPDSAELKRVELHLHTTMSALDATSSVADYVKRAISWGHDAIGITDHGVVQAFPEAAAAARRGDIKILYGVEAYLVDDTADTKSDINDDADEGQGEDQEEVKTKSKEPRYTHAVIFAKNQAGLKNLYTLISLSHLHYFYRKPRIYKSVLTEHREGLILGSACEAGELFRAVRSKKADDELEKIASFYDYLEIQPIGNNEYMLKSNLASSREELEAFNKKIVDLGERLNIPVVATCDVHFLDKSDEIYRRIIQSGNDFKDADAQPPLYFRTTDEMLAEFEYLGADKAFEVVVTNTRKIADSIEKLLPIPPTSHPPIIENAEEDLKKMAFAHAYETYGNPLPPMIAERMDTELNSIIKNGFAGMYITAQKLIEESERNGYLVGSRGSVGSSLVATMIGITEVNPMLAHYYCACNYFESVDDFSGMSGFDLPDKDCPNCQAKLKKDGHDIPFETFLGFDGDKEPDIDLNFSGEYQQKAHAHAENIFGTGQVFKSGTIATIAEKTAFGYVKKYFEARGINKRKAEINHIVSGCTGIKRTTGQHPGGLIIVPEGHSIYEFCPIQHPANQNKSGIITTHFTYHSMEGTLLKLDILGHDVPTILFLLHKFTGIDPQTVPLDDKDVIAFFTKAQSLGLPEFGTGFVRQMLIETSPSTFSDLVRISGLSHGTNVWTNNGQELIRNRQATLKEIIPSRDDIMVYLIHQGVTKKVAFKIMESVRKGRGITEEEAAEMLDCGIPDWYVDSCRKIEYLFPKAHAVAYVLMTMRIAYFKKYHPEAFYAATFSMQSAEFDYAAMCSGAEIAQTKYVELKALIEDKIIQDTAKDKSTLAIFEIVLEMYKRGINFAPIHVYKSDVSNFKPTAEGILPPLCTVTGLGRSVAEAIVNAREKGSFDTVDSFKDRCKVNKTVLNLLRKYNALDGIPETDQISLFEGA
ncbi:MAG: PolC-type DNA polymerase III [Turicibacter sp.]|nr:PolC-type DNA polymerase III [Turicibacter sp.]